VGLCYLLFIGVDFDQMWAKMSQCNLWWIGISLAFGVAAQIFRAIRWRMQLRAIGINPPMRAMTCSIFGTYAVNLVFPRLGEVWRTGYIAQRQHASFTSVFGSMVADRLTDTLTVLLMTIAVFIFANDAIVTYLVEVDIYNKIHAILTSRTVWCIIVAGIIISATIGYYYRKSAFVQRLYSICADLWHGFAGIKAMPHKGVWLLLTFGIWGCYFTSMWMAFYSFEETGAYLASHGILPAFVTFVFGSLAMGVPSNGGIGPWQWAVMFAITHVYGIMSQLDALAFANMVLGTQTILTIILGLYTFVAIALDKRTTHNKCHEI
jgi:hypothetical protein